MKKANSFRVVSFAVALANIVLVIFLFFFPVRTLPVGQTPVATQSYSPSCCTPRPDGTDLWEETPTLQVVVDLDVSRSEWRWSEIWRMEGFVDRLKDIFGATDFTPDCQYVMQVGEFVMIVASICIPFRDKDEDPFHFLPTDRLLRL